MDTVNTWNSGAWNRSVVDRTVTVTGVSLSTAVNSVDVTIPGNFCNQRRYNTAVVVHLLPPMPT